jgi:hypothetical protein
MEVEHRAARSSGPMHVALAVGAGGTHLQLVEVAEDEDEGDDASTHRTPKGGKRGDDGRTQNSGKPLDDRVLDALSEAGEAVSQSYLRDALRVRNQKLTAVLHKLASDGRIERPGGKHLWRSVVNEESQAVAP